MRGRALVTGIARGFDFASRRSREREGTRAGWCTEARAWGCTRIRPRAREWWEAGAGRRETRARRGAAKTPRRETTRREARDAEGRGWMIRAWFE